MTREAIGCFDRIALPDGAGVAWEMARPWRPPEPVLPEDPHEALPGLWKFAAQVWNEIALVFGSSRELAGRRYVSKKTHDRLGDWVRNLETLVRRIVIVAALALKLAPVKPDNRPAAKQWGPGRHRRALWHDPTSWKVSFRMIPQAGSGARYQRNRRKPPSPTRPAWRMAMRLEALRRVLSHGGACALRHARMLARIRARNARANAPREIALPGWDFHPLRRTTGKHAVNDGMVLAQPLAERAWAAFWDPG